MVLLTVFMENIIARNIFSQVDTEGHDKTVIKEVVNHRVNGKVVTKGNGFIVTRIGTCRPKVNTAGWEFIIVFNDRFTDWIPLKDLKNRIRLKVLNTLLLIR